MMLDSIEKINEFLYLIDSKAPSFAYKKLGISLTSLHYHVSRLDTYRSISKCGEIILPPNFKDSNGNHGGFFSFDTKEDDCFFNKKLNVDGFSFVIPTYNKMKNLSNSLYSIFLQEKPSIPIQIIIVDDGSTDGTEEYIKNLNVPKWISLEYFKIESADEWKSPSSAYNFGFTKVKFNYVVHFGADMILNNKRAIVEMAKHCEIDRYIYLSHARIPIDSVSKITHSKFTFFSNVNMLSIAGFSCAYPFIAVTSLDALEKIQFYSQGYESGPGEDDELLLKLKEIGVKFVRIPYIFGVHQDHPKGCPIVKSDRNNNICEKSLSKLKESIASGEVIKYE